MIRMTEQQIESFKERFIWQMNHPETWGQRNPDAKNTLDGDFFIPTQHISQEEAP